MFRFVKIVPGIVLQSSSFSQFDHLRMLNFGCLKGEKNRFFGYNFLTEDYNL